MIIMIGNILLIVSGILLFTLSIIILLSNPKNKVNLALTFFSWSGLVWLLTNLLANLTPNPNLALIYSRLTAGWMSGIMAVQGAVISRGISSPSPETIGATILSVGGLIAAVKWTQKIIREGGSLKIKK